jgi:putative redox protein
MSEIRHTHVELNGQSRWFTRATVGPHTVDTDSPASLGGQDKAPDPEEVLLAAYGSCTAMTVQMYAQRKGWPLANIVVDLKLTPKTAEHPDIIHRTISFEGPLDDEQRARLLQIADKCPVHRLLSGNPTLTTRLAEKVHD